MLSALEMQHLIETAFLPTTCRCQIDSHNHITVYLSEKGSILPEIMIPGFILSDLTTSRDIANFVSNVKEEYQIRRIVGPAHQKRSG